MPNKKQIVSIILPTYNRAHLIEESIKSVLRQSFQDFELLIIDDGSTDNTEEVVRNIDDPRIKYIKCSENRGASTARNIGINYSKGEYIAFQDSDDEWYSNKLQMHIDAFKNSSLDIGVVYTGFYRIKDGKKVYIPESWVTKMEGDIHQELLKENFISTQSALVRIECFKVVGLFDEDLPRFQDWDLFIRLSKDFQFKYIDKASFNQYFTSVSISSDQQALCKALEIIFNKYKNELKKNKLYAQFSYIIGGENCKNEDYTKGRQYLKKAILINPFTLKYSIKYLLTLFGKRFYTNISHIINFVKR